MGSICYCVLLLLLCSLVQGQARVQRKMASFDPFWNPVNPATGVPLWTCNAVGAPPIAPAAGAGRGGIYFFYTNGGGGILTPNEVLYIGKSVSNVIGRVLSHIAAPQLFGTHPNPHPDFIIDKTYYGLSNHWCYTFMEAPGFPLPETYLYEHLLFTSICVFANSPEHGGGFNLPGGAPDLCGRGIPFNTIPIKRHFDENIRDRMGPRRNNFFAVAPAVPRGFDIPPISENLVGIAAPVVGRPWPANSCIV